MPPDLFLIARLSINNGMGQGLPMASMIITELVRSFIAFNI